MCYINKSQKFNSLKALKQALENGKIAHALLDVLETEPMKEDCALKNVKNITFTPHVAWAPRECRQRLIEVVATNIKSFMDKNPKNVVNK